MSAQIAIDYARPTSRYHKPTLAERWEEYDREHPETYRLFARFALELIAAGRKHYSADAVVHRIRWHTAIEHGDDGFKINNNFVRCMSERFAFEHPQHREFFRRRPRGGQ